MINFLLLEYAHQMRPYADQFVFAVKPHREASEATADNLAAHVQPRRQRTVILAYGDLLNPALQRNLTAFRVSPGIVGGHVLDHLLP